MTRVLVKNNKTGRWSPRIKVDDHCKLNCDYFTRVSPKAGHGKAVVEAIYDFLVEQE